jgi:hypothetical protein
VETVPGWPSRIACRSWSETRAQAWLINQLVACVIEFNGIS